MKDSIGLVGQGFEFSGEINFDGSLNVDGKVNGSINGLNGTLSVGEAGIVEANVTTNICIVEGTLEGDLTAATRVEIAKTGRIKGKVNTRDLVIAEGAIFEGSLEMTKDQTFGK
ncbi:MAG: polymer-forming cytoskeletal protein [Gammaproteobacteria bacterium]